MILTTITLMVLGLGALLLHGLAEVALDVVFGYIGAWAVWLLSFGRVRIEPLSSGGESVLATWLGVLATFFVILAVGVLVQHFRHA